MTGTRFVPDMRKKHIEINLGLACNCKCVFCLADGNRNFVPFEQVRKELATHAEQQFNSVGFIGGEPTIYPGIVELGHECVRLGYSHIHIISNGRRFADSLFLDKLIRAGITRFSVSIHSHHSEVEDELTGVPGGFEEKILGLKNLYASIESKSIKTPVALNILINKRNIEELDATLLFFSDMGFTEMRLLTIRPENRAFENIDKVVPRLTQMREHLPAVLQAARSRGLGIRMDPSPFCVFHDLPGISRIIARDYIDQVIHSSRHVDREEFSWQQRRISYNRVKAAFCEQCVFDRVCEGVWRGYADRFGFDELHPIKDA